MKLDQNYDTQFCHLQVECLWTGTIRLGADRGITAFV